MDSSRITSSVKNHGGVPTLFVNDQPVNAAAYISYLDEHACYRDFSGAGYRMFSFPAYLGGRGINVHSGLKPFRKGIFDRKGEPDFTGFDKEVNQILEASRDALIFPRISLMMPEWWENENPDELNLLCDGTPCRESFSSSVWRQDAGDMLVTLIDHIESSAYCDHIMGYHIAGGGTEEWVHFGNPLGGFGKPAVKGFAAFMREYYPEDMAGITGLPDYSLYETTEEWIDETVNKTLIRFLEYTNWIIADSICHFAALVKKKTQNRLVTGAFYGYTMELADARNGHYDLKQLLRCPDIDFLCAPNSYMKCRSQGQDWANMSVLDSVKLHGKLWLSECDSRTYLTRPLKEARPGICPEGTYVGGVWEGPASPEVSLWTLRRNFARNLITGTGQWWFDMWGGWFSDPAMLKELALYIEEGERALSDKNRESVAEVAVLVDESSYRYLNPTTPLPVHWAYMQRDSLGLTGAPYDIYDISDMENLPDRYKLVIFTLTVNDQRCPEEQLRRLMKKVTERGGGLLFTYLPFCVRNGRFDPDHTESLTGIRTVRYTENEKSVLQRESLVGGQAVKWEYSPEYLSYIDDPDSTAVAFFSDGHCAAAYKQQDDKNGFIAYSALPGLNIPLLRAFYQKSGVHLYCNHRDVVYAGAHYIAIHAAEEGHKTLYLPSVCKVTELFSGTGSIISDRIDVSMQLYETRVYRLDPYGETAERAGGETGAQG